MSAKHKLNSAHLLSALAAAGMLGGLSESWLIFLVALAGLLVAAVVARDIRW